jgi:hypothetical protein
VAVSVIETIGAQTSADPGSLSATFSSTPLTGDVALVFVTFDDTVTSSSSVTLSGLGATWRLVSEYNVSNTGQWLGIYEATGLTGASSTLTVTESYTGVITRFGLSAFLLRGTAGLSPIYGITTGYDSSNPPVISHTPLVAGDIVLGMWLQANTTAPTITTVPAPGWTAGVQAVNGTSLQWRHIVAASTTAHTMDSNVSAFYVSLGIASQTGTAQVGSALAETMTVDTALERRVAAISLDAMTALISERRVARLTADAMVAAPDRTLASAYMEVMVKRRLFIGWGVPI